MELKDYTFEQIESEYLSRKKKMREERDAERAKIKRCRTCEHLGTCDRWGELVERPVKIKPYESYYCPFAERKMTDRWGQCKRIMAQSSKACEHYKERKE